MTSVDIRSRLEEEEPVIQEESRRNLIAAMSALVVLRLKEIEIRRQYLADIRYLD